MMSVAAVNAGPAVDDDLRAERANHADHVLERDAAPDFSRLLGRLYVTGVHGAREKLADAVVLVGGEEFFGADDAEFGALFRADGILSALAAGDGEKRDVGIEPPREVGEQAGPFVVGMRSDEKDARGDSGLIDSFDGFWEGLCGGGDGDCCG